MRSAPILAAAALDTACFLPGEPVERLDLEISLSSTRVRADSGVTVRLTATNWYWRPLHLRTTGGGVAWYRLVGPGNAELPHYGFGCPGILVEFHLAPGEAIVRDHLLPFRPQQGAGPVQRWPSGRYQIIGRLLDEDLDVVRETRPLTFELACSDPAWAYC